jgi:hypothetical protein
MRKSMALALFGVLAPFGSVVGGVFAALFDLTWWPRTFFSFAIVLVILDLLYIVFVPSIPVTASHRRAGRRYFDFLTCLVASRASRRLFSSILRGTKP